MKIERLLSIIILLLDKQIVSANTLAKTFEVSKRTIYRDIETLELAGFPIIAYPGKNGGFGLIDTFKMNKFTFNDIEKQKIIEALQLQEQLLSFQKTDSIVKGKLQAIQDITNKKTMSLSSATLHNPYIEEETNKKLKVLHEALTSNKKVKIDYITGQGETSKRTILPIELTLQNGSWYLKAFCELRKDIRLFKITRIRNFSILDFTFDSTSLPKDISREPITIEIELVFKKNALGKLYDFFMDEHLTINDDFITVNFSYDRTKNLMPFLLMFSDQVQVIKPIILKELHMETINKMNTIY